VQFSITAIIKKKQTNTCLYVNKMQLAMVFKLPFIQLVRWLRMISRHEVFNMEESVKFGKKNLVGVRNKFSLGITCANDPGGEGRDFNSCQYHWHENKAVE